jgi:hypothetical protein
VALSSSQPPAARHWSGLLRSTHALSSHPHIPQKNKQLQKMFFSFIYKFSTVQPP